MNINTRNLAMSMNRYVRSIAGLRRLSFPLVLAGLVCWLIPSVAGAQGLRWQLDLTGSRIQYDTLAALRSPTHQRCIRKEC